MAVLLPQYDLSLSRRHKLALARKQYRFNYKHITELAISESVPIAELPRPEWLLKVIEVFLNSSLNALAVDKNTDLDVPLNNLEERLNQLYADIGVFAPMDIFYSLLELLGVGRPEGRPRGLEDYELLFQTIEVPENHTQLFDDDYFAELRVSGPNPLVIQQVTELDSRFPVSDQDLWATAEFADDSLLAAGQEGRLYLADYSLFSVMQPGMLPTQPKFVYAPFALFARPRNSDRLKAVAIQCNPDPGTNPIFTPADGWAWQLAKAAVQVADTNHHELISHLAQTHLVLDPITVCTHRQLSSRHPLYVLLTPHFEGTLFINNLAHEILLPEGTPVPVLLTGDIASLHGQSIQSVQGFSFKDQYLPKLLKTRGVDDTGKLPHYPYRDDALKIWDSIHQWVSDYLDLYYRNDRDIERDYELQAWAAEISSDQGGRLQGFGNDDGIATLASLKDIATMIMFTASVQHAAVNFPQASHMTYVPQFPLAGYLPAPLDKNVGQEQFLEMFAPLDNAVMQIDVLTLLGSVYHTRLGQYGSSQFLDLRVQAPLKRFRKRLTEIEADIAQRNETDPHPYNTLRPSRIPQSINI